MDEIDIEECLIKLMWEAQNKKNSDDASSSDRRRWAVFYTDVEHVLAYYQSMLKPKPEGV